MVNNLANSTMVNSLAINIMVNNSLAISLMVNNSFANSIMVNNLANNVTLIVCYNTWHRAKTVAYCV